MTNDRPFTTEIMLAGPFRTPRQMLAAQEYDGHASIHDDAVAAELGFQGGAIEGPTHFSQFVPLLYELWGQDWFEQGCLSVHFRNICFEGEEVRALVGRSRHGERLVPVCMEKRDGTEVLRGTASLGPEHPETALEARLAGLKPPGRLVILRDLEIGRQSGPETVVMGAEQNMGAMYPFSLAQKLEAITEPSPWYAGSSPWGGAVIPLEMISVLAHYTSHEAFPVRGPSIGLFADQEVRLRGGPLMVGQEYTLERQIVAFSESRRTESYWVESRFRAADGCLAATMLLNNAVLKESYAAYGAEAAQAEGGS